MPISTLGLTPTASRIGAKSVAPSEKPLDPRAVITRALINAGGVFDVAAQDAVVLIAQAQMASRSIGEPLTTDETMGRIAVNQTALSAAIEEAKVASPQDFFDVGKADRLPENRRLITKMQIINRATADRGAIARLTKRVTSGHNSRPI